MTGLYGLQGNVVFFCAFAGTSEGITFGCKFKACRSWSRVGPTKG